MRSFTCVSVVVYVARKLRPCPSYSRRRDRINLVLWRSLDKGGGGTPFYDYNYQPVVEEYRKKKRHINPGSELADRRKCVEGEGWMWTLREVEELGLPEKD